MVEFEAIMKDRLKFYDSDTTDLFLSVLECGSHNTSARDQEELYVYMFTTKEDV